MSNQSIRSLLRAELSARRITHPHASYAGNKSNLLSCTVCHLVIKSESLWDGHVRSANHRKNVQRFQQAEQENGRGNGVENGEVGRSVSGGARKRKREADSMDVDGRGDDDTGLEAGSINGGQGGGGRKRKAEDEAEEDEPGDGRKKTKGNTSQSPARASQTLTSFVPASTPPSQSNTVALPTTEPASPPNPPHPTPSPSNIINEAEYAAFERDLLPLLTNPTNPNPTPKNPPNNSNITISAPPISFTEPTTTQRAAPDADQDRTNARSRREEEAEAEREEEGSRMAREFEVQEEMEGRVRRLREQRERIRLLGSAVSREDGDADKERDVGGGGERGLDEDDEEEDDTADFDGWGLQ